MLFLFCIMIIFEFLTYHFHLILLFFFAPTTMHFIIYFSVRTRNIIIVNYPAVVKCIFLEINLTGFLRLVGGLLAIASQVREIFVQQRERECRLRRL